MKHEFRTIQGCPVPKLIAPFCAIIVNDARATVNSTRHPPPQPEGTPP